MSLPDSVWIWQLFCFSLISTSGLALYRLWNEKICCSMTNYNTCASLLCECSIMNSLCLQFLISHLIRTYNVTSAKMWFITENMYLMMWNFHIPNNLCSNCNPLSIHMHTVNRLWFIMQFITSINQLYVIVCFILLNIFRDEANAAPTHLLMTVKAFTILVFVYLLKREPMRMKTWMVVVKSL